MSDEGKLVTARDRFECFVRGHDVTGWGTICGYCKRCHHSVWTYDGRSVLWHGEFVKYPPAHTPESEASLRQLGYTRHGVPEPRYEPLALPWDPSDRKAASSWAGSEALLEAQIMRERTPQQSQEP